MKQTYLRDQRGVAIVFELLLVAGVLALVGIAVYQANQHRSQTAAVQSTGAAPTSAAGLAASAAAVAGDDATSDNNLSSAADASATQLLSIDSDASNLGGSFDANTF